MVHSPRPALTFPAFSRVYFPLKTPLFNGPHGVTPRVTIISDQPTLRSLLGVNQQKPLDLTADVGGLGRKLVQDMETPRLEYRWKPQP